MRLAAGRPGPPHPIAILSILLFFLCAPFLSAEATSELIKTYKTKEIPQLCRLPKTAPLKRASFEWLKPFSAPWDRHSPNLDDSVLLQAIQLVTDDSLDGTLSTFFAAAQNKYPAPRLALFVVGMILSLAGLAVSILVCRCFVKESIAEDNAEIDRQVKAMTPTKTPTVTPQKSESVAAKGDTTSTQKKSEKTSKTRKEALQGSKKESQKAATPDRDQIAKKVGLERKMKILFRCLIGYVVFLAFVSAVILALAFSTYDTHSTLASRTNQIINTQIRQLKGDLLHGFCNNVGIFDGVLQNMNSGLTAKATIDTRLESSALLNNANLQQRMRDVNSLAHKLTGVTGTNGNKLEQMFNGVWNQFELILSDIQTNDETEKKYIPLFEKLKESFSNAEKIMTKIRSNNGVFPFGNSSTDIETHIVTFIKDTMYKIPSAQSIEIEVTKFTEIIFSAAEKLQNSVNRFEKIRVDVNTNIFVSLGLAVFFCLSVVVCACLICFLRKIKMCFLILAMISLMLPLVLLSITTFVPLTEYSSGCNYLLNKEQHISNVSSRVVSTFYEPHMNFTSMVPSCKLSVSYHSVFGKLLEAIVQREFIIFEKKIKTFANDIDLQQTIVELLNNTIAEAQTFDTVFETVFNLKLCDHKEEDRDKHPSLKNYVYRYVCEDVVFLGQPLLNVYAKTSIDYITSMLNLVKADGVNSTLRPFQELAVALNNTKDLSKLQSATKTRLFNELNTHRAILNTTFYNAYDLKCGLTTIYENMVHAMCDPITEPLQALEYVTYLSTIGIILLGWAFLLNSYIIHGIEKQKKIEISDMQLPDKPVESQPSIQQVQQSPNSVQQTPTKSEKAAVISDSKQTSEKAEKKQPSNKAEKRKAARKSGKNALSTKKSKYSRKRKVKQNNPDGLTAKVDRIDGASATHHGNLQIFGNIPATPQQHKFADTDFAPYASVSLEENLMAVDIGYDIETVVDIEDANNSAAVSMNEEWYKLLVELLKWSNHRNRARMALPKETLDKLLAEMEKVLEDPKPLAEISGPVVIVGDIHGQYEDLLRMFNMFNEGQVHGVFTRRYLFLGDYVDRGNRSLHCVVLLFLLKILYPNQFVILRGNHETYNVNHAFGFEQELKTHYEEGNDGIALHAAFNRIFDRLPLVGLVGKKILCMHGGINHNLSFEQIQQIPLPLEYDAWSKIDYQLLVTDLIWADPMIDLNNPCEVPNTHRRISKFFGEEVVRTVCNNMNVDLIVRGHMEMQSGFGLFCDRKLISIFSAPDYPRDEWASKLEAAKEKGSEIQIDEFVENIGSVLDVDKDGKVRICMMVPASSSGKGPLRFITYISRNNEYANFARYKNGKLVAPTHEVDSKRLGIQPTSTSQKDNNA